MILGPCQAAENLGLVASNMEGSVVCVFAALYGFSTFIGRNEDSDHAIVFPHVFSITCQTPNVSL
jgi:hypothetical protein